MEYRVISSGAENAIHFESGEKLADLVRDVVVDQVASLTDASAVAWHARLVR